jgi:O-antigen ligase
MDAPLPRWLPWLQLACASVAGAIWYLVSSAGPWPLLLVLAPWVLQWLWTRKPPRPSGYELPLLLFLLSAAVGIWAAFDRQAALAKFWRIAGGVSLFYALRAAAILGRKRVWLLSAFGAAVALYFLATHDWVSYPAKIPALTRLGQLIQAPLPPVSLHRLHPNVAGGILAMMAPFAALSTLWSWQRLRGALPGRGHRSVSSALPTLCLAAGLLLLTLFGLLMSTSRAAWIALGCALLLALLWTLARRVARSLPALGPWLVPGIVTLLLLAMLLLSAARPGWTVALLRALPGPETGFSRVELLRNSMSLVRDYPFTGAGLGSFQLLYSTYVLFLHVGYIIHSHNLLVDVAVEQGLLGVAALVWMWAILGLGAARRSARSMLKPPQPGAPADGEAAGLALGVLCLVVLFVHGLADDVLYGSRAVLLLFLPLAFCCRGMAEPPGVPGPRPWLKRWEVVLPAALVILLGVALIWRKPLLSRLYSNLGAVHQSQAELTVYSWPEYHLQDEVRRTIDLGVPVGEFEIALALNPANGTANRRLGMIDLAQGRYDLALTHLEAAYASEPGSEVTRSLLAEAYVANGRLQEGMSMFASVGNAGGRLAARVYWYAYIGDGERHEWMRQAIEGR